MIIIVVIILWFYWLIILYGCLWIWWCFNQGDWIWGDSWKMSPHSAHSLTALRNRLSKNVRECCCCKKKRLIFGRGMLSDAAIEGHWRSAWFQMKMSWKWNVSLSCKESRGEEMERLPCFFWSRFWRFVGWGFQWRPPIGRAEPSLPHEQPSATTPQHAPHLHTNWRRKEPAGTGSKWKEGSEERSGRGPATHGIRRRSEKKRQSCVFRRITGWLARLPWSAHPHKSFPKRRQHHTGSISRSTVSGVWRSLLAVALF